MKNQITETFVSPLEVQQMFNISRVTEIKWRKEGLLPNPLYMGRRVYYKASDLISIETTNQRPRKN